MTTAAREDAEPFGAGYRPNQWLRVPVEFLIHQFLSTWGLFTAVPMVFAFILEAGLHFGLRIYMNQIDWVLYGTPFFPLHVIMAFMVGWVLGGTLRERSMLWVWVLPFVSLCTSQIGFPLIGRGFSEDYRLLALSGQLEYSWGRFGVYSLQQIVRITLLYTAVAYSLGALLAFTVVRAPTFFDQMRSLRKVRLIWLVGVPWLSLKFLLSWKSVSTQLSATGGSADLLHYYLQGLFMMSVFMTFVFAIVVSLAGRRFAITRFFLRPSG